MDAGNLETLKKSKDPAQLVRAASALARSRAADDQSGLLAHLQSGEFLQKLDSDADYDAPEQDLNLEDVIDELAQNTDANARATLDALTQDGVFLSEPRRIDMLIEASVEVRPPTPALVDFWDKCSAPEAGYIGQAIDAMLANGSSAALELFERKIVEGKHAHEEKVEWLRLYACMHSDEQPVLVSCGRLLRNKKTPKELRPILVEALFDFRPFEWFGSLGGDIPCPDRAGADENAKRELRQIGEYALDNVDLTTGQKKAVEGTLAELG